MTQHISEKHIGKSVMTLADLDNVSAKAIYKNFQIYSSLTRIYKYEGEGESVFRIFTNAKVNGEEIPYVILNLKYRMTIGKSDGRLKNIYNTINKDIESEFSSIAKIMKPGNFLFYNLVNSQIQTKKCSVELYLKNNVNIKGEIIGHIKRSRKAGNKSNIPFILLIDCNNETKKVPIDTVDLILFKNRPIFENTQKGIIANISTELLRNGHVCRGEPLARYIVDICNSEVKFIYLDDKLELFTVPQLEDNDHDNDINNIIKNINRS